MALSSIYESFIANFENKLITSAIFLDIAKAFDSVNHQILLKKLECYGIRGLPHSLMQSYLSDRYQYTLVDGQRSSLLPISCGVPQGSVLGPFLFSIFLNDLPKVTCMEVTLFADDACFNFAHHNSNILEQQVNQELEKISTWFQDNKLTLNVEKTNFMLIHRRNQPIELNLKLNGIKITQKDQIKYLGIFIDEKLNWKPHINSCITKLNKCMWAITKLRPYTSLSTLRLVYYSLAYPYIQYCISSWGGACKTTLQPLLVKQKLLVKTMLQQSYTSPSSPLFHQLGLLKLQDVYKFQIGKLMYNQIRKNNVICQNLSSLPAVHSYNTRSSNKCNYFIPSVSSNLGKTSFSYCGPVLWNSLPVEIKSATNFQYKSVLKNHLLESYLG